MFTPRNKKTKKHKLLSAIFLSVLFVGQFFVADYTKASIIANDNDPQYHTLYTPQQCTATYGNKGYSDGTNGQTSVNLDAAKRISISQENQSESSFVGAGGGTAVDGQIFWNVKDLNATTKQVNTKIELNTATLVNGRAEYFISVPLQNSTKSETYIIRYNPGTDQKPNSADDFVTGVWLVRFNPAEEHGCGAYDLRTVYSDGNMSNYGTTWIWKNDSNSAYFTNPAEKRGDGSINNQPQLAKLLGIATNTRNQEASANKELANTTLNPKDLSKIQNGRTVGDDGTCSLNPLNFHLINCVTQGLYYIMFAFMWLAGWIASLFDLVFDKTVLNMSDQIKRMTVINDAWKTFRDLSNIFFIFALIYASIGTILQLHTYNVKQLISKLIIAALLINFSLFFTKAIIDASNIVATEFYSHITFQDGDTKANITQSKLGTALLSIVRIQSFYADGKTPNAVDADPGRNFARSEHPFLLFAMGIIFAFFFTIVMLAVTLTFIGRFVTFIGLLILSPLAFVAPILPGGEEMSNEWKKSLINNAIYAPAFLIMIWVVLRIANDPTFKDGLGLTAFSSAFSDTPKTSALGVVLNFIILITMLIFSVTISKRLGISGAENSAALFAKMRSKGTNFAKGAVLAYPQKKWNQFAHNAEHRLENSEEGEELKRQATQDTWRGKWARKQIALTHAATEFSLGGKAGVDSHGNSTGGLPFVQSLKAKTEMLEKNDDAYAREVRNKPEKLASHLKKLAEDKKDPTSYDRAKRIYEGLSPKEQAVQDNYFEKKGSLTAMAKPKDPITGKETQYFKTSDAVTQERNRAKEGHLSYHQTETQHILDSTTTTPAEKSSAVKTQLTTLNDAQLGGLNKETLSDLIKNHGAAFQDRMTPELLKSLISSKKLQEDDFDTVANLFKEKLKNQKESLDKNVTLLIKKEDELESTKGTKTDVEKGFIKGEIDNLKDTINKESVHYSKAEKFADNGDGRFIGLSGHSADKLTTTAREKIKAASESSKSSIITP